MFPAPIHCHTSLPEITSRTSKSTQLTAQWAKRGLPSSPLHIKRPVCNMNSWCTMMAGGHRPQGTQRLSLPKAPLLCCWSCPKGTFPFTAWYSSACFSEAAMLSKVSGYCWMGWSITAGVECREGVFPYCIYFKTVDLPGPQEEKKK